MAISFWPGSHVGGFQPYFSMGANKAAVEAMCRYYAVALAKRGITVNTVCAGITDDSIVNALPQEAQDALLNWLRGGWNPMGRPGTPADIWRGSGHALLGRCGVDYGADDRGGWGDLLDEHRGSSRVSAGLIVSVPHGGPAVLIAAFAGQRITNPSGLPRAALRRQGSAAGG